MRALALVLGWLALLLAAPASAQEFPALSGRVVDAANILPPAVEASLTEKLAALETQSQRQLVVATVPSLDGYEISDYGYRLGRAWGLGDKGRNDGAILLIAPTERKVRIEVGYGLEPVLTDGLSALIVQNTILPQFRAGDMPGGIVAGTDAIIRQLQLPAEEAARVAAEAEARPREGGFPIGVLIWGGFILFFFVLPLFARRRRGRAYNGTLTGSSMGDIVLWEVGKGIARGMSDGDGGGWGGGGFGGGGFSGGGGSFGGGGASGSW